MIFSIISICIAAASILLDVVSGKYFWKTLWGANSLHYLWPAVLPSLLILLAMLGITGMYSRTTRLKELSGDSFPHGGMKSHQDYLFISISALVLFVLFRVKTHFLGDGYALLKALGAGELFYPSNLLDFYLHARLAGFLKAAFAAGPSASYLFWGAAAGILFCCAAWYFLNTVSIPGPRSFLILLFTVCCGTSLLFFGYVESYALYVAAVSWFLAVAVEYLRGRINWWVPVLLFGITCLLHQTGVLLFPALLYLLYRGTEPSLRFKILLRSLLGLGGIVLFFAVLFVVAGFDLKAYFAMLSERSGGISTRLFLPLFREKGFTLFQGDPVFSLRHLLDYLNVQLLAGLSPFLLIPVILLLKEKKKDPASTFLFLAYIVPFAAFFALKAVLGLFRDWDLFSFPCVAGAFFAAYHLATWNAGKLKTGVLVFLTAAALFHFTNWVSVNANEQAGLHRFADMAEFSPFCRDPVVRASHFEVVADYYGMKQDPQQQQFYLKKAESALFSAMMTKLKVSEDYQKAGLSLYRENRLDEAAADLQKALLINPNLPNRYSVLIQIGEVYMHAGKTLEAYNAFEEAGKTKPEMPESYNNRAVLRHQAGDLKGAVIFYRRALDRKPDYANAHFNLAMAYLAMGNSSDAADQYQQALKCGYPAVPDFELQLKSKLKKP